MCHGIDDLIKRSVMMDESQRKAAALVEALPYIQRFRDSVVVVKFGGSAMDDPETREGVLRDIVFMECAGMRPVIVHGGGKRITARLQETGIESRFINGLRYTDDETMKVVDDVLHNEVNIDLVERMRRLDGKPFPVSGRNVLRAERVTTTDPETGQDADLGHVGRVINIDTEQLNWVLNRREVPVITPVAADMNGVVYNVNADMAACRIATELGADKLVFLSDVPGLLKDSSDPESVIPTLRCSETEESIHQGIIAGGMVPKVRSAAEAVEAGTGKVHMVDGRVANALLLEIFTDKGVGTEIVPG